MGVILPPHVWLWKCKGYVRKFGKALVRLSNTSCLSRQTWNSHRHNPTVVNFSLFQSPGSSALCCDRVWIAVAPSSTVWSLELLPGRAKRGTSALRALVGASHLAPPKHRRLGKEGGMSTSYVLTNLSSSLCQQNNLRLCIFLWITIS